MRVAFRVALPLVVLAACLWLLSQRVSADMLAQLPEKLAVIAGWQWAAGLCLTAVSLFSVGRYDVLTHRFLRTGLPDWAAGWTGSIGIAVGQSLGFGLITGGLARWRMMPALGMGGALKLSAFVSVSFVMAWGVVVSLTFLLLPSPGWATALGALGCVVTLCALGLSLRWPQLALARWKVRVPSLRMSAAMVGWAFVDTVTAAGVLFVFLPPGTMSFSHFFPMFLMGLGAALISNTPGGVGPFELVMLGALPDLPVETVMTAIVAYRIVYYAVPATLGALALLRPFRVEAAAPPAVLPVSPKAPRSEVGVLAQNGGAVRRFGRVHLGLLPLGQSLTLMFDPVQGKGTAVLRAVRGHARALALSPLIYKCGPRLARAARAQRWQVLHIADEAIVPLAHFDLSSPRCRTLRRKLRAAEQAGVSLRCGGPLPHAALAQVDAAWQVRQGPPRGASMGRYCPHYLVDQWVGSAWVDGRCVAFVTAHRSAEEYCLDIMRSADDCPDGAMHALVHAALEAARHAGARRFSLASTPACPNPGSAIWRWVSMQIVTRAGGPGLRQFKSNFNPVWVPRYAAAPGIASLVIGLIDMTRAIHRPAPVRSSTTNAAHHLDENYELDSSRAA